MTTITGEDLLPRLQEVYLDLHRYPELSFAEHRTAGVSANWLRGRGFAVTEGVGRTGVTGVLRRGEGPVVLLRADMDALLVAENTGLSFASQARGIDPVGSVQAGTKANIIPDQAELLLNVRSYDPEVRQRVLAAITRIVEGEALVAGAPRPPHIESIETAPAVVNDADGATRTRPALEEVVGPVG